LTEEPEIYISPSAQAYVMDFLVAQSVDKKLSFVIATHSPRLIQNLNYDELITLYQTQLGSRIADKATYGAYLRNIGLQSKKYQ
jgi:predicted ATP-dependent endonuclease of OLD family